MQSTVSQHPQKQRVIDGILAGESIRDIAASVSPPLSRAAVARFRQAVVAPAVKQSFHKLNELKRMRDECAPADPTSIVPPRGNTNHLDAVAARETERSALVNPFLKRIATKYDRYDKLLDKATAAAEPDLKAIAALDACETRSMDLHAKLVGAIAPEASQQVTNNIVLMLPRPVDDAPARPMLDDGNVIDIEPVY